jgi:hypothetical protein
MAPAKNAGAVHDDRTDWDSALAHTLAGFLKRCFHEVIFHEEPL